MSNELVVAPSILAADFGNLASEIQSAHEAGADWIHVDVMDGHFVPPITFGPNVVKAAKATVTIPIDVHLMIEQPERQIDAFADAGADRITVHYEACPHLHRVLQMIRKRGVQPGVAINPGTNVEVVKSVIKEVDLVLVMTVNPGWGGQSYIPASTARVREVADLIASANADVWIEVDGGIDETTSKEVKAAGATALVAGSYIFGSNEYKERIASLRS